MEAGYLSENERRMVALLGGVEGGVTMTGLSSCMPEMLMLNGCICLLGEGKGGWLVIGAADIMGPK